MEAIQQRCDARRTHIAQHPRHNERGAALRPLEVKLFGAVELPRWHLAKDHIGIFRMGQKTFAGLTSETHAYDDRAAVVAGEVTGTPVRDDSLEGGSRD